jgi:hypothetical protein
MEEKIYKRQVVKQSLSNRVVDDQMPESHYTAAESRNFMTFDESCPTGETVDVLKYVEDVVLSGSHPDKVLAKLLRHRPSMIVSIEDHDSILKDVEEAHLSEEERRQADEDFNRELAADQNRFTGEVGIASGTGLQPIAHGQSIGAVKSPDILFGPSQTHSTVGPIRFLNPL